MPETTGASFGFILRKPGEPAEDETGDDTAPVYLGPHFAEPLRWWQTNAGSDPRGDVRSEWALSLPHQCGEWEIWDGAREDVLDAALRFRDELDQAIAVLQADTDRPRAQESTGPDLGRRIRDLLNAPVPGLSPVAAEFCGLQPGPTHAQMRAALLAVLAGHPPVDPYPSAEARGLQSGTRLCHGCKDQMARYSDVVYPCRTIRAIARSLGIVVCDA